MDAGLTDVDLVASYLGGDSAAFRTINDFIQAAFAGWRRKLASRQDEIESDVHYKLLISFRREEFDYRASLRTYVSRIVNHTCIDFLRYQSKFSENEIEELNLPDQSESQEQQLEEKQLARLIFRVLRLLPRDCIKLWRMRLQQDLSCAQIGAVWGKTEGNIRRRLWECRQKAKEIREKLLERDKPFPD